MWKCKRLGLFARIVRAPCTCTLKCKKSWKFWRFFWDTTKSFCQKAKTSWNFFDFLNRNSIWQFFGLQKIHKKSWKFVYFLYRNSIWRFLECKKITKSWKNREISRKPKNSRIIIFNLKRHGKTRHLEFHQFHDIFDKKLEILTCATEAFPAHASKNVKAKVAIGRFVKVF